MRTRFKPDYSLYFVTDPYLCADRGLVETALAAVNGGATIVQLRNPNANGRRLVEESRALVAALRPRKIPVIINDRIDVAIAADADGAHVGQSDISAADARALLGGEKLLGLSIDQPDQITEIENGLCDYFGVGPVFATNTKSDALPAIGVAGLSDIVKISSRSTVAIGGIQLVNTAQVAASGVSGIAVVSAIAGAANPRAAATALLATFRDNKPPM